MQAAPAQSSFRRELLLLLVLLGVGAAVKGWVWAASPVLTRDGVGFLEYASRLHEESWGHVLRTTDQHPLYPFHVLSMAWLCQSFLQTPLTCYDWEFCAHLANFVAGLLLVVPMFFLGKRLGGVAVGFGGALLFQVLPVPVRVTIDTLTEGTYLLFAALSLWTAVRGLDSRRVGWLFLAGLCGGFAYLTRPEGALLPLCLVVTLLGLHLLGREGFSFRRTAGAIAAVSLATLVVVVPYWWTIGGLSAKATFRQMVAMGHVAAPVQDEAAAPSDEEAGAGLLLASRFQPGVDGDEYDVTPLFVLWEVLKEIGKGFHYIVWLPALLAVPVLVRRFRTIQQDASFLLLFMVTGCNLLILLWLGYRAHYVSERHTVLLVLLGCGPAILGVQAVAQWWCQRSPRFQGRAVSVQGFTIALLLGFGLVQALQPLHEHRRGHRYAGEWLRTQFKEGDRLVDAYGWVSFYSGRRTPPQKDQTPARGRLFLVMEEGERDWWRNKMINDVPRRSEATAAFSWPIGKNRRVIVYEIPPRLRADVPPAEQTTATGTTSVPARN